MSKPSSSELGWRRGWRKKQESVLEEDGKEALVPDNPTVQPTSSVGMSMSIGTSQNFGEYKVDVTAWATLACGPTKEDAERAYERCAGLVEAELDKRAGAVDALWSRVFDTNEEST